MDIGIEHTPEHGRLPFRAVGGGLALLVLLGVSAWIYQLTQGLIATGMRDVVSWGLYIFTFAFFVGLSAGGPDHGLGSRRLRRQEPEAAPHGSASSPPRHRSQSRR